MYSVTKEIRFCYGHRLLNHKGKCRHLHGHNARALITLESESLDEMGMVYDFKDIESVVKAWIDEHIDHNMLMHREDPFLAAVQEAGERVYVRDATPTAENIAKLIFEVTQQAGLPVTEVLLWETATAYARYAPKG